MLHVEPLSLDGIFACIGIVVAVWSVAMCLWSLRTSFYRETVVLTALAVAAVALYHERRARAAE